MIIGGKKMSTLEKTINILNTLPEKQIEMIYSYVQFIYTQQEESKRKKVQTSSEILKGLVGVLPDSGKTLEQYRNERIKERYEIAD